MLTQFVAPALYLALRFAPGGCRIRILPCTGKSTWTDPADVLGKALRRILGVYPATHLDESCDGRIEIHAYRKSVTPGDASQNGFDARDRRA
jgi:hypothetical protein